MNPFRALPPLLVTAALSTSLHAVTVLVDFGGNSSTGNWNRISSAASGSVANAIDNTGASTGMTVAITSKFSDVNTQGTTSATAPYPSFATSDSFYGNALQEWTGFQPIPKSTVTFSNLLVGTSYTFTFFASRTGVSDNRTTRYTVAGTGPSSFVELDAANNVLNTVTVSNVTPDSLGRITLDVAPGTGNNNPYGFYYLGAAQITYVPEPGAPMLLAAGTMTALLVRRRNRKNFA